MNGSSTQELLSGSIVLKLEKMLCQHYCFYIPHRTHVSSSLVSAEQDTVGKSVFRAALRQKCPACVLCGASHSIIAAKQLNRQYIGIEREHEYVDIAQARLKAIPNTLFQEAAE